MSVPKRTQSRFSRAFALGIFSAIALSRPAMADGIYMTNMKAQLTADSISQFTSPNRVPGAKDGDVVEFVLSATVANAVGGPGVYFTSYIQPGVEVLGATFVTDITGITERAPGGGGHAHDGWGLRGSKSPFGGPFAAALNGRQNDIYGDTGVFYSTDPRTRLFTADSSNIAKGPIGNPTNTSGASNGYNVTDTFYKGIGAFNLWDADQVNAFGTGGALNSIPVNAAPTSSAPVINSIGQGVTPFGSGSSVAGPDTGYTMDNTGNVGPWQRIRYPGSQKADIADGPATAIGTADTPTVMDVSGVGYGLSDASSLPSGTNAVRWSYGLGMLNEVVFVKIRARLNSAVLSAPDGVVMNFESTGSDNWGSGSKDNPWRYFGPTFAKSATLYLAKEISKVDGKAYSGGLIPAGATITYKVRYANLGNLPAVSVSITDKLPAGIATTGCAVTSPTFSNLSSGVSVGTISSGSATCPAAGATVTFANLPNAVGGKMGGVRGGEFTYDVKLSSVLANGTVVSNNATFTATDAVAGTVITQTASASGTIGVPQYIDVVKSAGVLTKAAGKTFNLPYTIVVGNTGTVTASNVQAVDNLVRTFGTAPVITVSAFSVTPNAPATAANCTGPASAYNGVGNIALLAGNQSLPVGGSCVINFTVNLDYTTNSLPAVIQTNDAWASSASGPNSGHTVPNSGAVTAPANALAVDQSTNALVLPGSPNADIPSSTPVSFPKQKIGASKNKVSITPIGSSAIYAITHDIKVINEGDGPLSNIDITDQLIGTGINIPFTTAEASGPGLGVQSKVIYVAPALAGSVAPVIQALYDGSATNAVVATGGVLSPGDSVIVRTVTHVKPTGGKKIGQAIARSKDSSGNSVDDKSNNGTSPNSGNPGNDNTKDSQDAVNDVPTEIRFASISGKVWKDDNNNQIKDGAETSLDTTISVSGIGLTNAVSTVTVGGAYSVVVPVSSTAYTVTETNPTSPAGLNEGYSLKAAVAANPAVPLVAIAGSSVIAGLLTDAVDGSGAPILDYINNDFTELPKGSVGVAKRVVSAVPVPGQLGQFDITHEYLIENKGLVPLNNVQLSDALFGTSATVSSPWQAAEIVGVQSITITNLANGATATANTVGGTGYSGDGNVGGNAVKLIVAGSLPADTPSIKTAIMVRMTVRVKAAAGLRNGQAVADASDPIGNPINDKSVNNLSATMTSTPNGGKPDDLANDTPTPITFGQISGRVYEDLNNNGLYEAGNTPAEKGIGGVKLVVKGGDLPTSGIETISDSTDTTAKGSYNVLVPIASASAKFSVEEVQPAGYSDGKDTAGSQGASSSANAIAQAAGTVFNGGTDGLFNIALTEANFVSTDNNFGELVGGSLSVAKRVKSVAPVTGQADQFDVSYEYNVINPSPVSISNVTLTDPLFNGATGIVVPFIAGEVVGIQSISAPVVTSGSSLIPATTGAGGYSGDGSSVSTQTIISGGTLAANATAQFTMTTRVKPNAGDHNSQVSINGKDPGDAVVTDKSNDGTVPSGDSLTPLPFASVSGFVYKDNNNDGVQTGATETGVAGRTVTLAGGTLSGTTPTISVATDTTGAFSFTLPVLAANDPTYSLAKSAAASGFSDGKTWQPASTGGTGTPSIGASATMTSVKPNLAIAYPGHAFGELPKGSVGLAKRVVSNVPVATAPGQFDVVYEYKVSNSGLVELQNVLISDTLVGANGSGAPFKSAELVTVKSLSSVTAPATGSTLSLNTTSGIGAFDGTATSNVLVTSVSNLKPGASGAFQLNLRIKPEAGAHDSQAEVVAKDVAGSSVSDKSTNGTTPTAGDPAKPADDAANNIKTPLNYASLSGSVYKDSNNNGVQDSGEQGIGGVVITAKDGVLPASTSIAAATKPDGSYAIIVPVGTNYTVEETQPAGYGDGKDTAGTGANANNGTVASGAGLSEGVGADRITSISAANPIVYAGYNFGEAVGGLSGHIWVDLNKDQSQKTGEADFKDIPVRVYPCCGYVDSITGQNYIDIKTDAAGNYSAELPSGAARIVITRPANFELTTASTEDQTVQVIAGTNTAALNTGYFPLGPDLKVNLSHSPAKFTINNTGTFTIVVNNAGQQPTVGSYSVLAQLAEGLKVNAEALSTAGTGWKCSLVATTSADQVRCDSTEAIGAGAASPNPIQLKAFVKETVTTSAVIANKVLVKGGGETTADRQPTPIEEAALTDPNAQLSACGPANACQDALQVQKPASVSGSAWLESASANQQNEKGELPLPGWRVAVIDDADPAHPLVKGTAVVDASGHYKIDNIEPTTASSKYRLQFFDDTQASVDPLKALPWITPVNNSGTAQSASNTNRFAVDIGSLPAGTTLAAQDLPLDPSGVVYDAVTRQPVANAVVNFCRKGAPMAPTDLINGVLYNVVDASCVSMITGAAGAYQFILQAGVTGEFTLDISSVPSGYLPGMAKSIPPKTITLNSAAPPAGVADANPATPAFEVQAQAGSPPVGESTTYFVSFALAPGAKDVIHNHIPLDPSVPTKIFASKTGDRSIVELGDTLKYTIQIRHASGSPLPAVIAMDHLPAGFKYIPGSTTIEGAAVTDAVAGITGVGPQLNFKLGPLAVNQLLTFTYRARAGVGSLQGTGINVVQAVSDTVRSNEARFKVKVTGGVFTSEACVLGKIFVDCNGNSIQDAEEIGIPGVRLYLEDGTYLVSDVEGKYSYCGLKPMTHMLKVDATTLPRGSRLTTSSNRNAGDANSLFLDIKNGELHRADFIEGSCSNTVLEQVKARRSQGEVRSPETEKQGGPALKFHGKAAGYPQQGTDSANQPLVKPRLSIPSSIPARGIESENNIPVPDLPAASPNTISK
jgi:uncharacterized repeat protein (TIGR01451 family)